VASVWNAGLGGRNTTRKPPVNASIQRSIPHGDRDAGYQFKPAWHALRIHERSDVMLNEPAFVPGLVRRGSQTILQWCERARPVRKIHHRGPNHDWYVNPRPSWLDQSAKSAEYSEHDKDEVKQEHEARGKSFDHITPPIGRLTHQANRQAAPTLAKLEPRTGPTGSVQGLASSVQLPGRTQRFGAAGTGRFLRYEFFKQILSPRKVNRSQPWTSTRAPSARVPVNVHSDTPRSPWTR
jgi:hypothetical protein